MSEIKSVLDLPDVSFIENDTIEQMMSRLVSNYEAKYEELTGKSITLEQSDPEMVKLNAVALLLYQVAQYVDRSGKQNLLKYSYGEFLDNIGAGRAVTRKPSSAAVTEVEFTISEVRSSATGIPAGTKVTDGNNNFFQTDEYCEIPASCTGATVKATCTEAGTGANGISIGGINQMVDPVPYIQSVSNTQTTYGGADVESDDDYRERIFLATDSYSVAGPADAYVYRAKTYSTTIGDVKVVSPSAGEVDVYIMMADGSLPEDGILEGLEEYLKDNNFRPLTDLVSVKKPSKTEFNLDMTYYIAKSDKAKADTIQSQVTNAIEEYLKWQEQTIGRDINPSELIKRIILAGAKRAEIRSPAYTVVDDEKVARLKTKNIVYGGVESD